MAVIALGRMKTKNSLAGDRGCARSRAPFLAEAAWFNPVVLPSDFAFCRVMDLIDLSMRILFKMNDRDLHHDITQGGTYKVTLDD